jgi:DNA-binding NtrC family response regulator
MKDKFRILLVDDEWPVLRSEQKMLSYEGFEVATAQNSQQALQLFQQARQAGSPFQVAIVDLKMANLEGVETIEAGFELLQKLLDLQPDLPVIVLTAYDTVAMVKTALKAGARDFFVKGQDEDLAALVRKALRHA